MKLWRSMLFVPGNNVRMVENALSLAADAVILDLEDSVPLDEKETARKRIPGSLRRLSDRGIPVFVRVNSIASGLVLPDLEVAIQPSCSGIVLPKVGEVDDLRGVSEEMKGIEERRLGEAGLIPVLPLIESPLGVLNVLDIARFNRVIAMAFGALDFARNLGVRVRNNASALAFPRALIPIAASAAGIPAVDAPWFNLKDERGLIQDAHQARDLGFSGKLVIHPRQIDIVNEAFSPKAEEVEWARKVIREFEVAGRMKRGAIPVDGIMVDEANYLQCKQLVSFYDEVRSRSISRGIDRRQSPRNQD